MHPGHPSSTGRYTLLIVTMAWCTVAVGQGDRGSLTEQFPNMSAKERSRIAAKETDEAGKDASYQEVMRTAELAFQEGRYEDAIVGYEQARAMRPYNVYPKVKIEDLRALIAKQAAKPDTTAVVEVHPVEPDPPPPAAVQVIEPVKPAVISPVEETPPPVTSRPQAVEIPVKEEPAAPASKGSSAKPADGIIEQRYREGHAFVIERAVTIEGRLVKYKRVYHPYGQTFYFEDGLPVDERVWKARFPDN